MDSFTLVRRYFDAWDRRDSTAIVALFSRDGTFRDPTSGRELTGEEIGRHAEALFAGFPDLSFEITSTAGAGESLVAAQWLLRGTFSGPFFDAPPSGRRIEVAGVDFLSVDPETIKAVRRHFDQKDFFEQAGLQVVVQPRTIGPIELGTSVFMSAGSTRKPGAFSLTRIGVSSERDNAEVDRHAEAVLEQLAEIPGFISTVLTTIGSGGHTITAWEDAEAPKRILGAAAHKEAVATFFGSSFTTGGMTSVWVPERMRAWHRCGRCEQMATLDDPGRPRICKCGATLPDDLPYW